MQGSFPLPLGRINCGEKEYRNSINPEEAIQKLGSAGVSNPEVRLDSFVESFPRRMKWLRENGGRFSWRYTTDPWKVFVAEVLLMQCDRYRVSDLYEQFLERFKSPYKIINAREDEVEKYLEEIGLSNQRIRTYKEAAEQFVNQQGQVPNSLEGLQEPHGSGPYISRATMLFAFGEPVALYDTNMESFLEEQFGLTDLSHEEGLEVMESLTPQDAGIARAMYFSILDQQDS